MGQIGLPCTLPPPPGQSETKFFLLLGFPPPPRYQKSMPSVKSWVGLPVLGHFQNGRHRNPETTCSGPFSKWPPSKSGNHVLCHNLSSAAVRVTQLVSMHMFLGVRNSIMPIKNVSVLWKISKQLFKRIFRAFSAIFCVIPWDREGYCAPSTYENLRPSFFC